MITATMVVATVPVTDLERAKQFYGETVGLTYLWETPVAVRYRCGSVSEISVFKRPPLATEHTLAHFEVDDIESTVKDLTARGVEFLDYTAGQEREPAASTAETISPDQRLTSGRPRRGQRRSGPEHASAKHRSPA